ncbi:hypothetical protein [Ramlibacter humi]|uniref:Glycosyltransferase RgtA/B/C/D-like domain-containing protein n=1 Tax=Ramlibacter humi TaxID=2530451 RepID=A0A4Z0BZ64_9BURK|nr:hypothetical protein [Ramlibacter humi]TFZ03824.1 hypothetical protein EZ216_09230 [Ramlibacter humi]
MTAPRFFLVSGTGCVLALVLLVRALWLCGVGLDFSDEGLYLQWLAHPGVYPASVTQFGFAYHPLHDILNGDLAGLRRANLLLTALLAWGLGLRLAAGPREVRTDPALRHGGAFILAASSLCLLLLWLPTPSYNSLALQGLLLAGVGQFGLRKTEGRADAANLLLVAAGGWVTFLAKPTTAAVLFLLTATYLAVAGLLTLRRIAWLSAWLAGLAITSCWLIAGSVQAFVQRVALGLEDAQVLSPAYSSSRLLQLVWPEMARNEIRGLAAVFALTAVLLLLLRSQKRLVRAAGVLLAIAGPVYALGALTGIVRGIPNIGYRGLWLLGVAGGGAVVQAWLFIRAQPDTRRSWPEHLARFGWLLLAPFGFAFGTSSDLWATSALAGCFWLMAAFASAISTGGSHSHDGGRPDSGGVAVASLGLALITVFLAYSMAHPYRQSAALAKQNDPVQIGGRGELRTDAATAGFLNSLLPAARAAGLGQGTRVVDLTGRLPGVLAALGATSLGQAWLIGGYPGSERSARRALQRVGCDEFARAWVITEPAGSRRLDPSLLSAGGSDLARDYHPAVHALLPPNHQSEASEVVFFRPTRPLDQALAACERARTGMP